jgi:hypothetical protein
MRLRSILLAGFLFVTLSLASSFAEVDISVNFAPPVLPVIEQPACPVEGYIWTPSYWAWGGGDYYLVPGVWVAPPTVGVLWTPPWWGWNNGAYVFNEGYWGPTVGFYGGINYGHGYWGDGYWGGRWVGNSFSYNTAITRVNKTVIHNTYIDRNVVNKQVNRSHTSFNGPNGVKAQPTAEQKAAAEKKVPPTSQQLARQNAAKEDPKLQAKNNHGHPNNEAIKSFNQTHEHGKGAEGVGAAGGAGAGKGENKTGNVAAEHNAQGAGMTGEEHGNKHAGENQGNKHEGQNLHGNNQNLEGNQVMAHNKVPRHGGEHAMNQHAMNQHAMNQQMHHQQQMGQHHQQQMGGNQMRMGGNHPAMGGNRPHPQGQQQQQGKKKPDKP